MILDGNLDLYKERKHYEGEERELRHLKEA